MKKYITDTNFILRYLLADNKEQYKTNKIIEIMHSFLSYKGIETEKDLFHNALEIYQNHNIHIVDSIIAAKSLLDDVPLLTFDKKLELILQK